MATKVSPQTRLAEAALRLLAKKAWREISLIEIAKAAKVPASELAAIASAKPHVVGLILRLMGDKVAKSYRPERMAKSGRDRLFDVAMAWFDAMTASKKAIRALYKGFRNDPVMVVAVRGDVIAASEWLMTLAEADKGPALALRAAAFAAVLARAIPVWLDDDADMTKTMARLDGDLRRGESWLGRL